MNNPPPSQVFGPTINRLADLMAHSTRYAFRGTSRLAFDACVSPASVSRIVNGKMNPSSEMINRLTGALERDFGARIDPRDVAMEHGQFPTRFVCDVVGCPGCLPDQAYDEFGDRKKAFTNINPGEWVTSRFPKGYGARKEERAQ